MSYTGISVWEKSKVIIEKSLVKYGCLSITV